MPGDDMKKKTLYEKAQLLKAGQVVEINGDYFQAEKVNEDPFESCCQNCDLDSICRDEVFEVCCEMETAASHFWRLKLAHPL